MYPFKWLSLKITTMDLFLFGVCIRRGFHLMEGYSPKPFSYDSRAQFSNLLTALEEILVSI
jgi:hypothetical protein